MQSTTIDTVIRVVRSASDGRFKIKFMGRHLKIKGRCQPTSPGLATRTKARRTEARKASTRA